MSISGLDPTKRIGLIQSGHHIISSICITCFRHDIAEKLLNWHIQ